LRVGWRRATGCSCERSFKTSMDEVRTSPTRNPRADAAKARLRTSTFPAKHKRALWGCNPPRDSGNGCDAGVGRQVKGMKRATARPCPLRFFHRMHSRSAGVLCHPSKILGSGATPRPSPNPRPRPLWNNPKTYDHSDRKTRPQFGQSLKITRSQSGKTLQHQFGSQHPPTTIAVFGLISKPRLGWKRQAWPVPASRLRDRPCPDPRGAVFFHQETPLH
jgi:hypothetical protein